MKKLLITVNILMLMITLSCSGEEENTDTIKTNNTNIMNIKIGDRTLTATLVDNSSVDALLESLSKRNNFV